MRRLLPLLPVAALSLALAAPAAAAPRVVRLKGFASPGTPAKYNKVGILEFGSRRAKNVLVLNPGTSASAAYFAPLAETIVGNAKDWQVWSVERRENLLEDHSMLDQVMRGKASLQQLYVYYLGWIGNSSAGPHF
ncbi:MAG: hypothetical protein QOJ07_1950, partial [Thermoleophilaceae bacterium]|nr:hypothetical protein [Thermoleophilaceae bacterium]